VSLLAENEDVNRDILQALEENNRILKAMLIALEILASCDNLIDDVED